MNETDIAIVGAGIIGLACAFRLASEGADVLLIDRDAPGMGCSFGNAAHIATEQVFPLASPQTLRALPSLLFNPSSPLNIDLAYATRIAPWLLRFAKNSLPNRYQSGVEALAAIQCIAAGEMHQLLKAADAQDTLHMHGHLMLVEQKKSRAQAERRRREAAKHDVNSEWKAPDDVLALAPDVTPDIAGAIFYPNTGHLSDPYTVCLKLLDAFNNAGGRIAKNRIDYIATRTPAGFYLEGPSGRIKAAKVIVAAGAWSHKLSLQLGCDAPLEAERGYNISVPSYRTQMQTPVSSFERNVIMTPLNEGLRITGCVEFAGLIKPANERNIRKLKSHLQALVPDINLTDATSWLGHRPSLPDHLPVIGATKKCKNAYFAFGHQHLGLTLAGATASIMSAIINGKKPPIDPTPYSIDRF